MQTLQVNISRNPPNGWYWDVVLRDGEKAYVVGRDVALKLDQAVTESTRLIQQNITTLAST